MLHRVLRQQVATIYSQESIRGVTAGDGQGGMTRAFSLAICLTVALALSGCATSSAPPPAVNYAPPTAPPPAALPMGPFTSTTIAQALGGRTFAYTEPNGSGTITFETDGTFSYQDSTRGSGTGVWQPSNDKLCEAFDPTAALPRGTPSQCKPFSSDGTAFTVGQRVMRPA